MYVQRGYAEYTTSGGRGGAAGREREKGPPSLCWAKELAGLARAAVESAFSGDVIGFGGGDRTMLAWERVAERAAEAAAERARWAEPVWRAA